MNKHTRIKIRKRLMDHLPPHTVTFVFSGLPIRQSADANYPFFVNRNFVYTTGIEEEGAILVLDNGKEILFLRDVDPHMEKWVGHYMRKEEAQAISGIKDVRYFDEFDQFLNRVLNRKTRIGLDLDQKNFTE
ncbi:MAG TPA: aminopeptidase P N-terminal domain-containing protein, partial [Erysipelothrix sp.]|nr:aminopeptidase P N-terminal domain-containing protein [Erysipelothrix sp.]